MVFCWCFAASHTKRPCTFSQEVVNQQRSRAANLTPIDKLKEKATAAAMKKQYNVFDYYRHSKLQYTLEDLT